MDELPDNEAADAQVSAAEEPSPDSAEADSQADENVIDLEALLGDQLQTPLEAGLTITIEQSCPPAGGLHRGGDEPHPGDSPPT